MTDVQRVRKLQNHPFESNQEYLESYISLLSDLCRMRLGEMKIDECGLPGGLHKEQPSHRISRLQYGKREMRFRKRVEETVRKGEVDLPLIRLSQQFGLSPFEESVIIAAMAYCSDHSFEILMDSATDSSRFCISSILRLFFEDQKDRIAARSNFLPGSRLSSSGLLEIAGRRNWSSMNEENFLGITPELPLRTSSIILGQELHLGSIGGTTELIKPSLTLEDLFISPETVEEIIRMVEYEKLRGAEIRSSSEDASESGIVVLYGPPGTGKHHAAQAIAGMLGKNLFRIKTIHFLRRGFDEPEDLTRLLAEARLNNAIPCFSLAEPLLDEDPFDQMTDVFATELTSFGDTVLLTVNGSPDLGGNVGRLVCQAIHIDYPSVEKRRELIEKLIPEDLPRAEDLDLSLVAGRLNCSSSSLRKVVKAACSRASRRAGSDHQLRSDDFEPRLESGPVLSRDEDDSAYQMKPRACLADVILPAVVRKDVESIVRAARSRVRVLDEWGLGKTYGTGTGLSALLFGPPGTGKTLTAEAIASELDLQLSVVQISGIMNKYVGETEKRIASVFRSAASSGDVLLFDEADALFACRVDGSRENSYYINNHINALLKEMDDYSGIVLLSSNRPSSIDPAFERRIRWILEFPPPDAQLREMIWRKLLPPTVPLAEDVDFGTLAREFDFTGGYIRSAILRAAYEAASLEVPLSMQMLREAGARVRLDGSKSTAGSIGFDTSA